MATERRATQAARIPDDIIAQLGDQKWPARKTGLQRLNELLASDGDSGLAGAAAEHLARLAGDEKWEVRNAVAGALRHLLHPEFDRILAQLIDDSNGYVRRSAAQTLQRRRELVQSVEDKGSETDVLLREILSCLC